MKEELLEKLRREEKEIKLSNRRINNLKKNPDFFNDKNITVRKINRTIDSKHDGIIRYLIDKYIDEIDYKDTNHIYVKVSDLKYRNLEQRNIICFKDLDDLRLKEFLRKNIIIDPKSYLLNPNQFMEMYEYERIRIEFFKEAIRTNQQKAKQKIIKRYVETYKEDR